MTGLEWNEPWADVEPKDEICAIAWADDLCSRLLTKAELEPHNWSDLKHEAARIIADALLAGPPIRVSPPPKAEGPQREGA